MKTNPALGEIVDERKELLVEIQANLRILQEATTVLDDLLTDNNGESTSQKLQSMKGALAVLNQQLHEIFYTLNEDPMVKIEMLRDIDRHPAMRGLLTKVCMILRGGKSEKVSQWHDQLVQIIDDIHDRTSFMLNAAYSLASVMSKSEVDPVKLIIRQVREGAGSQDVSGK